MPPPPLDRIAFVGTYVPRRCGIATFTHDLRNAFAAGADVECLVVAMNDRDRRHDYPGEVRFECADDDAGGFRRIADFLNVSNVDVVSLQHEYGIFGGDAGANVLGLLSELRVPVHTTLHTVLARPSDAERRVMAEVLHLSSRVAVMTERGRELLRVVYGVAAERIDVIPHGIPETSSEGRGHGLSRLGLDGCRAILTFGLLSPNKGIEHAIAALPEVVARHPDVRYLVVGATHPNLLREQGDAYRESLEKLARDLGVADHVRFHDRYVDTPELLALLEAADVYVTPYLSEDQIVSGTLAYAFGCGKAVVSTPYWHAKELLADGAGLLVPFRDSAAIASAILSLLDDDDLLGSLQRRGYAAGRGMVWPRVAERYREAFHQARSAGAVKHRRASASAAPPARTHGLPPLSLDHLFRLTDSTGLLQHAVYDIPRFSEGYCTDDNARALKLLVQIEELGIDPTGTRGVAGIYAAFLDHAFDPATGRFRNFLSFDRRWLDASGSDDSLGRAIAAIGACIGRSKRHPLACWATSLVAPAVRAAVDCTSPRAWALSIIGLRDILRRFDGDRVAIAALHALTRRLAGLRRAQATPEWPWFEEIVAYENPRLCEGLIAGGDATGDERAVAMGLESLEWLATIQRSTHGRFSPVGCRGFFQRRGERPEFDQQPIEAQSMIDACLEAFRVTGDATWSERAWNAFEWFRGHNVLGMALCNPSTGGCRDGLMVDRTNDNQGAESTLAYLAALVAMRNFVRVPAPMPPARSSARPRARGTI